MALTIAGVMAVAMVAGLLVGQSIVPTPAAAQSAVRTNVVDMPTYTLLTATRLVSATTVSASPNRVGGIDISDTRGYAGADVFIAAEGEGDWALDATVELSPDRVHWAPVRYEQLGFDDNGIDVIQTTPPLTRWLSPDRDTDYMMLVLANQYLRVNLAATGTVTPTVWVTYRDYPQWP
jgi:hypothetical protein